MGLHTLPSDRTIVAPATAEGEAAVAIVRLSGPQAIAIAETLFRGRRSLLDAAGQTLHFGRLHHEGEWIDEVLLSLFRAPHSYTGDDVVEFACHGSRYIVQRVLQACRALGAEMARPGEFTMRAFLNAKLDLSQAESVADLIAAENRTQHDLALKQMRGGYSDQLQHLRNELLEFAALMELELDFAEEDVEFADRGRFSALLERIRSTVDNLIQSFAWGNVLKQGIPVAIVGAPNAGKSTLLNALLREEKALVSEVAGTTRDFIEDTVHLDGILFRFIDTAGLRHTNDRLEAMGIERSYQKLQEARVILCLADITRPHRDIANEVQALPVQDGQSVLLLLNKSDRMPNCDAYDMEEAVSTLCGRPALEISAATGRNLDRLQEWLLRRVREEQQRYGDTLLVTNARHADALERTRLHLLHIEDGLRAGLSGDLLSPDIRLALHALGEITGAVEVDRDLLGMIFGKFCIGK